MLSWESVQVCVVHPAPESVITEFDTFQQSFDVRVMTDGQSVLEQLECDDEVVILDWELETPDARGVIDVVRHRLPEARVLVLTGDVPADDPIGRGADEYLVTPLQGAALATAVEQLCIQTAYEKTMKEYFQLATERALLENEREAGIAVEDRYEVVTAELEVCQRRADELRAAFSREEYGRTLRRLLGE